MVTRRAAGITGEQPPIQAAEQITLQKAIELFTSEAAAQLGRSEKAGSIARGRWADLVVLDQDPFAIPSTAVHSIKAVMTLVNGEIVFDGTTER